MVTSQKYSFHFLQHVRNGHVVLSEGSPQLQLILTPIKNLKLIT
jgi:hypothetical protein